MYTADIVRAGSVAFEERDARTLFEYLHELDRRGYSLAPRPDFGRGDRDPLDWQRLGPQSEHRQEVGGETGVLDSLFSHMVRQSRSVPQQGHREAVELAGFLDQLLHCWGPTFAIDGNRPDEAWVEGAMKVCERFEVEDDGHRYLYMILLHPWSLREPKEALGRGDAWGIYVGETGTRPLERFWKHRAGIKASRWVQKFGVALLSAETWHLRFASSREAKRIERDLAAALTGAGYVVKGGH